MSTHQKHKGGEVYFVTFTCFKWLPLIEESNAYEAFKGFFQYLKDLKVNLIGYVIMPNHFHGIINIPETCPKNLNLIIGNGKRFLAYEIVKRLKEQNKFDLLKQMKEGVQEKESIKGKKHQVFRLSFDAKVCISEKEVFIKLNYIHLNPVSGKWNLASDFVSYPYSSASFYELNVENDFLTHFMDVL